MVLEWISSLWYSWVAFYLKKANLTDLNDRLLCTKVNNLLAAVYLNGFDIGNFYDILL